MEMARYEGEYSHLGSKFNLPIIVFLMNVNFWNVCERELEGGFFYVGWIY